MATDKENKKPILNQPKQQKEKGDALTQFSDAFNNWIRRNARPIIIISVTASLILGIVLLFIAIFSGKNPEVTKLFTIANYQRIMLERDYYRERLMEEEKDLSAFKAQCFIIQGTEVQNKTMQSSDPFQAINSEVFPNNKYFLSPNIFAPENKMGSQMGLMGANECKSAIGGGSGLASTFFLQNVPAEKLEGLKNDFQQVIDIAKKENEFIEEVYFSYYMIGIIQYLLGGYDEAKKAFENALDGNLVELLIPHTKLYFAFILEQQAKFQDAIKTYDKYFDEFENDLELGFLLPIAYWHQGLCYEATGNFEKAGQIYSDFLEPTTSKGKIVSDWFNKNTIKGNQASARRDLNRQFNLIRGKLETAIDRVNTLKIIKEKNPEALVYYEHDPKAPSIARPAEVIKEEMKKIKEAREEEQSLRKMYEQQQQQMQQQMQQQIQIPPPSENTGESDEIEINLGDNEATESEPSSVETNEDAIDDDQNQAEVNVDDTENANIDENNTELNQTESANHSEQNPVDSPTEPQDEPAETGND